VRFAAEYVNKGNAIVTPIDKVLNVIQRSEYGRRIKAAGKAAVQKLTHPVATSSRSRAAESHPF
jgi:hypothetical protein